MNTSETLTPQDRRDRAEMIRLFEERGPMTEDQLVCAGIARDSIARNREWVAARVREKEAA